MQFAHQLEASAHRSSGGEYAWRRPEALLAARALADAGFAILGGELWLVHNGEIHGVLPQRLGPPAVYHWESKRLPAESWAAFVARSHTESCSAINALPAEAEIEAPPGAEIYYNLTWLSQDE
jgi:hypothetical protein